MMPVVINPNGTAQTVPIIEAIKLYESNNPDPHAHRSYSKRTSDERQQLRRESQKRYRLRKRERMHTASGY